ncbi:MAG: hypothetical protein OXF30_01855 [Candidatus Saccharibacteria bacterium]|nr:hypothetical protein [Candidatus Saccharibacteria bacterium]
MEKTNIIALVLQIIISYFLIRIAWKTSKTNEASLNLQKEILQKDIDREKLQIKKETQQKEKQRRKKLTLQIGLINKFHIELEKNLRKAKEQRDASFQDWLQSNKTQDNKIPRLKLNIKIKEDTDEFWKMFKTLRKENELRWKSEYQIITGEEPE